MHRSLQEAMDEAEELADWFEAEGPSPENRRPVKEYYLEYISEERDSARAEIAELVVAARKAGASWLEIGEALGKSAAESEAQFSRAADLMDSKPVLHEQVAEAPTVEDVIRLRDAARIPECVQGRSRGRHDDPCG
ncbi:MAG: hypothetical protein OXC06_13780 [Acidimicrobiaceae bacterium]|nr:hypothetical protein [Acidimicrobiaceae bacterium]